jgi:chromosome segregation ATPase
MQMNDRENSDYQKFRLDGAPLAAAPDDDQQDSSFEDETKDLRIEKLNRRLTLVSILLPCLIVIAVLAAYADLKKRDEKLQQTNTVEVRKLIEELESQLNALSVKYAKLGFSIDEKIPSISKTAASLEDSLKQTGKSLQTISTAKADKKELKEAEGRMEKTFAEMRKDLENLRSESQTANERLNQTLLQFNQSIEGLKKDISATKSTTTAHLSQKMDKSDLDAALKTNQEAFRQELNQVFKRIIAKEKRLTSLEEKIQSIERNLKTDFRNKPLNQLAPPKAATIVEQNMAE